MQKRSATVEREIKLEQGAPLEAVVLGRLLYKRLEAAVCLASQGQIHTRF